jgi:hypothetical protein
MVPPVIRPAATAIAPFQITKVIEPKMMKIAIAVMIERTRMRRLAVAKTLCTASANLLASRFCWLKACTIFIAPRTSLVTVPTLAMRSWLRVEIARTRRPRIASGNMTRTVPTRMERASLGASANRMQTQAIPSSALRRATETVVPTTCSMIVVSTVMREVISAGLFSSKKPGDRRSRLR